MTKEECLNKHDTSRKYIEQTCRPELFAAMDEYAKQQAIAFFKWNAKNISIYLDYLRRVDEAEGEEEMELELNHFENNSIEGRYTLFVENQFIEQQNKP